MEKWNQRLRRCSNLLLMDQVLFYVSSLQAALSSPKSSSNNVHDPIDNFRAILKSLPQQKWVITRNNSRIQPCMRLLQSLGLSPYFEGVIQVPGSLLRLKEHLMSTTTTGSGDKNSICILMIGVTGSATVRGGSGTTNENVEEVSSQNEQNRILFSEAKKIGFVTIQIDSNSSSYQSPPESDGVDTIIHNLFNTDLWCTLSNQLETYQYTRAPSEKKLSPVKSTPTPNTTHSNSKSPAPLSSSPVKKSELPLEQQQPSHQPPRHSINTISNQQLQQQLHNYLGYSQKGTPVISKNELILSSYVKNESHHSRRPTTLEPVHVTPSLENNDSSSSPPSLALRASSRHESTLSDLLENPEASLKVRKHKKNRKKKKREYDDPGTNNSIVTSGNTKKKRKKKKKKELSERGEEDQCGEASQKLPPLRIDAMAGSNKRSTSSLLPDSNENDLLEEFDLDHRPPRSITTSPMYKPFETSGP